MFQRVQRPLLAIVGVSLRDANIAIADLLEGDFLVDQVGEGSEDSHLATSSFEFLGILEKHVEEGGVGEVDRFQLLFELA